MRKTIRKKKRKICDCLHPHLFCFGIVWQTHTHTHLQTLYQWTVCVCGSKCYYSSYTLYPASSTSNFYFVCFPHNPILRYNSHSSPPRSVSFRILLVLVTYILLFLFFLLSFYTFFYIYNTDTHTHKNPSLYYCATPHYVYDAVCP